MNPTLSFSGLFDLAIIGRTDRRRQDGAQPSIIHAVVHMGEECAARPDARDRIKRHAKVRVRGVWPFPQRVDDPDINASEKRDHLVSCFMKISGITD